MSEDLGNEWERIKATMAAPSAGSTAAGRNGVTPSSRLAVLASARAYVAKIPGAISGQGGHPATFKVACHLVLGFDLSIAEARPLLHEFNARCQPPWTDKELEHKLSDADKKPGPRGYLLARRHDLVRQVQGPASDGKPAPEEPECPLPPSTENEVAQFPVKVFPAGLVRFALETAQAKDCPADMPGVWMLGVAAAAIGASRALAIKQDWIEAPRLYLGVVASPGMAKTPSMNAVCQPLYRRQNQYRVEHDRLKAYARDSGEEAPTFRHLYTTNATTEKLAEMLQDNPRGLALIKDELAGWVSGMNQYKGGKGDDRDFWLQAWSGAPIKIDRKSQERGPVLVTHPFVVVLGGIQPGRLSMLCDEQSQNDGFLDRILFTYPAQGVSHWSTDAVTPQAVAAWEMAIYRLFDLQMVQEEDSARPFILHASPEAMTRWVEWVNGHEEQMGVEDFPPAMEGPWAKMRSHCLRLALVIHMLRWACGETESADEVDGVSMLRGTVLAEYFKSHILKAWGRIESSPEDLRVRQTYEWALKKGGEVTARQLLARKTGGIAKISQAQKTFKDMEDRGFGKVVERRGSNGRIVEVFVVNKRDLKNENATE